MEAIREVDGLDVMFQPVPARVQAGCSVRVGGVLSPAGRLRRFQLFELLPNQSERAGLARVRVRGTAMADDGVHDGDCLVLDRSGRMREGQTLLAYVDGCTVLRRLRRGRLVAVPSSALPFPVGGEVRVLGAVVGVLRKRGFVRRKTIARDGEGSNLRSGVNGRETPPVVTHLDAHRVRRLRALEQRLRVLRATYLTTEHPRLRSALRDEARRVRREAECERARLAWGMRVVNERRHGNPHRGNGHEEPNA